MLPASADAHCGNNKCLWHGHHHYYRHVRLEPQDSIKEWQAQWRAAKTKPIGWVGHPIPLPLYPPEEAPLEYARAVEPEAEGSSTGPCSGSEWAPSPTGWPGPWVRAQGLPGPGPKGTGRFAQ
jgi:hypothetical protein